MKCVPDIPYGTSNGLMLDLYLPDRLNAKACIVYAHGGGFRKGDRQDGAAAHFAERLTSAGFAMAAVSYRLNTKLETFSEQEQRYIESYARRTSSIGFRLSPKLFGPAFIAATEDVSRAIEFLWVEGGNLGILSRKTGVLGISAGGIAGLALAFPPTHWQTQLVKPDSVVAVSAAIVQPWRLNAQAPPCLMLHGPDDRIIPLEDAQFGANRATHVGAPISLINTGVPGHAPQVSAILDSTLGAKGTGFMDLILEQFEAMLAQES